MNAIPDGFYELTYPDGTHHRTVVETYYGQQRVLVGELHMKVYMWFPLDPGYTRHTVEGCTFTPLELSEAEQKDVRSLAGKPADEIWRNLGYAVPIFRDRI